MLETAAPTGSHDPAQVAWLDVTAGAAGDMICGAFVDAGVPMEVLQAAADAVIPGQIRWVETEVRRAGLRARLVSPDVGTAPATARTWTQVRTLLEAADLAPPVAASALAVFDRLATAEGRVHGIPTAEVHFHEVGAQDSIADIVGAAAALHHLDVAEVVASPLAVGRGRVTTAHGELPVPVPAVAELCRGWRVTTGGDGECATPTGAALVTTLATRCSEPPAMSLDRVGVGAGQRDPEGRANIVRVLLGHLDRSTDASYEQVVIEANVDDLDPRVWPSVVDALLARGASDAWLVPVLMKRGRPAHTIRVLTDVEAVGTIRDCLFETTSTIGVRQTSVTKYELPRRHITVAVGNDEVRIKVAGDHGRIRTATPEFRDVERVAAARCAPIADVLRDAVVAADAAGLTPGAPMPGEAS